jgi:membrane protease YdiL (CAAX protease family)
MTDKRRIPAILRGHLLLFERRAAPTYSAATGFALLAIFVGLEFVVGPRGRLLTWLGIEIPLTWERVAIFAGVTILAALLARAKPSDIGLISPGKWTATEGLYLAQIALAATAIFIAIYGSRLATLAGDQAALKAFAVLVGTQVLWGFYQELIYRGLLQTELVRRFGALAGIILADLAFTFGPLHFYEWSGSGPLSSKLILFGATFAIGALFGYIFLRTRNIVLIGILHGIGDAFANTPRALG